LEVLAGERPPVMVAPHQGLGLELVDEAVRLREAPVRVRLVPPAVEPDPADLAVAREQLLQLAVHVVEIAIPLAAVGAGRMLTGPAPGKVIRVVAVELRG